MDAPSLISAALDELLSSDTKLSVTLQKIKAIAHFINNQELRQWASLELRGYVGKDIKVPQYRVIGVAPKADLVHEQHGFIGDIRSGIDIITEYLEPEIRKLLRERAVGNSIAEIELIADKDDNPIIPINHYLTNLISKKIYAPHGWHIQRAWLLIPVTQMTGVLSAVRSKTIDILLDLDQLDKDISLQSLKGKQAAIETVSKALNSSINVGAGGVVNFSHGDNTTQAANTGSAAHVNTASGHAITQSTSTESSDMLRGLLDQLSQHIATDAAFDATREELEQQIATVKVQLQKPEPKKGIIKRAMESITELAADGAGAVAGHAVFELLKQAPHLLSSMGVM